MLRHDTDQWKTAMNEGMAAVTKKQVWILQNLPEGRNSLPNRRIFRYKTDSKERIERYRTRLVVKGYKQKEGVDFKKTFSPVVRFDTIRFLLALSTEKP